MNVYVLQDDTGEVCGVYSTHEKADEYLKGMLGVGYKERKAYYSIEEHRLDW